MKVLKAILALVPAIGIIALFNTKMGSIPPAGKFLDPFHGFWHNAESKNHVDDVIQLKGLKGKVQVALDDHMIPHVFAENDYDLYFAQGYITARHRLWQMDFQTRYASGRLSEAIGEKAIELDRYQRRMGMVYGAENMVKELEKYPIIKRMTEAYADGVNAYIKSLRPQDYPIEFKILDYKPEKWSPLNTALLLKLMSATLAGGSDEFYMSNALRKFGKDTIENLFPDFPFKNDPIIPEGTKWNFKPVPVPAVPATEYQAVNPSVFTNKKEEGIGSNNWAVSGTKTVNGYPLLANDPHLELSLPSIWYQIQMAAPGINACGVSIPGAPGVIIGFNQKVAWGVTNVNADVLDFYSIKFKDSSCKEYWYNNQWNKTDIRIEEIRIRNNNAIRDTVYYTHHGPVVYLNKPKNFTKARNIPQGYALRWIAHDPSVDVATFYYLNRANNYADYRKALAYYTAPAQNFVFASIDNDVAISPNGYIPLKWHAQGKYLLDGTKIENDWHGRIPATQNPIVRNPPQGFVSSANQPSTDKSYPYYINWEFSGYERAHRINTRLAVMQRATVDSVRNLQNDNYSVHAENVLPLMIKLIDINRLNASERRAYNIVKNWNKYFDSKEVGASIFEIWQKDVYNRIWSDDFIDANAPMRFPSRDRTVHLLLEEENSQWFDDIRTPEKENRSDIVEAAFKFTVDSLERRFGPISKEWQWANVKQSHVPHLAKIAGFGSSILLNGGSKTSVNALSESHGPSWRMVVELGKVTKGYGVFPGGQSGNPGSFYYDDMIDTWTNGRLNQLLFLKSANQNTKRIIQQITLEKK
ncbi:penicillin acylase family protein [Arcticibacter tournemirensis]